MKDYPNREALRKAHDIYRDAMRPFIIRCLKRVLGEKVEDLILDFLDDLQVEQFERDLQQHSGSIETTVQAAIDISDFPHIIRKYWNHDRAFSREFDLNSRIQSKTDTIVESRNSWAHPGIEDVDPEHAQANLTYVAEVLGEIRNIEAKQAVEDIRDRLFSGEVEECPIEVENAAYKERLADMTKQLDLAKTENVELEKQIKTKSDRLEEVEAEWLACEERLETVSTRLRIAVAGKTVAEERLSDISNRLENAEAELTAYKEDLARTLRQLDEAKTEQTEHLSAEERLTRALTESEIEETEKAEYKEDFRVALPTGKEMEQPVLEFLADREEYRRVEIIDFLTEHFSLTDDERRYLSRSGQAERHLMNRNLIERTRTGYYRITFYGLEVLHQNVTDEDGVYSNEVYVETPSSPGNTAKAPKSQRKWRRPGAVAALRDPAEIRNAEAKIAKILNPSEKTRLERELREAKRAVSSSAT